MGTDKVEVVGAPRAGRKVAGWLTIVFMNIWVPVLTALETLIGIAISPLLLVIWVLVTGWPFGKIVRHFIWMYGRVWVWMVSPFVRFELIGADPDLSARPNMYVANHLSFFDIFLLAGMPVFDVVICLRSWPFKMAWYTPFMRCAEYLDVESLPWERIVEKTQRFFSEGRSMLLFPQGHRSRDGRLGRFYSGAFKLAVQFNVPVVPICIMGSDRLFPPGRRWLAPSHIRLHCLEPIDPSRFAGELGHVELRKHVKQKMEVCLAGNRS